MSYNGTVHCRHCYGKGHNRRTCPDFTEQIKVRAQRELDSDQGVQGYYGKQFAKRTGKYIDGTDATELKATRRGSKRRCSYCNLTGHNRKTCVELKKHRAEYVTGNIEFRTKLLVELKNRGLGVGALVQRDEYGTDCLYIVNGVAWSGLTIKTPTYEAIQLQRLNGADNVSRWQRNPSVNLPNLEDLVENGFTQYQVVAPVTGSAVESTVPEGWIHDEAGLEVHFGKEAQSPNHYENRWE